METKRQFYCIKSKFLDFTATLGAKPQFSRFPPMKVDASKSKKNTIGRKITMCAAAAYIWSLWKKTILQVDFG